jgi:hypothetical protein
MKLRVALLTMALLLVVGPQVRAQQRIEELVDLSAVDVIKRMGGTVFPLSTCRLKRDVETVSLPTASDDDLKYLIPFLNRLPRLRTLSLAHNTRITAAGLAMLKDLPNLLALDLNYTNVGDPEMEFVKPLRQLQELRLSHTRVSDVGVDKIRGLSNLRVLVLSFTKVTDAATDIVRASYPVLETLKMCGTVLDDKGLEPLKDVKTLRLLTIRRTNVTEKGVRELQQALPDLVIDFGPEV